MEDRTHTIVEIYQRAWSDRKFMNILVNEGVDRALEAVNLTMDDDQREKLKKILETPMETNPYTILKMVCTVLETVSSTEQDPPPPPPPWGKEEPTFDEVSDENLKKLYQNMIGE